MAEALFILSCSSEKLDVASPAKRLYRGALFRKSVSLVERHDGEYVILSARHGVVRPNDILAPYDQSLAKMSRRERMMWAASANMQLRVMAYGRQLVALCGEHYRVALAGFDVRIPLFGLPIGEQLRALSDESLRLF